MIKEKIEAIRAACVRANPAIMELKFNRDDVAFFCEIINPKFHWMTPPETATEKIERNQFENKFKFKLDRRIHDIQQECIVGSPIRLANVLLALKARRHALVGHGDEDRLETVEKWGAVFDEYAIENELEFLWGKYDLSKDDLREQSPETVEFLYQLLK